jgi:hypothetical protein
MGRCMVRDIERDIPSVQQLDKLAKFVYLCKNLKSRNYGLISESERGCVSNGLKYRDLCG